jgi:hypothetical protein
MGKILVYMAEDSQWILNLPIEVKWGHDFYYHIMIHSLMELSPS